jgi:hypothetical protein
MITKRLIGIMVQLLKQRGPIARRQSGQIFGRGSREDQSHQRLSLKETIEVKLCPGHALKKRGGTKRRLSR